jgi:hypothetical protein
MATITVRKLDSKTWEPQQGNGQSNFISDLEAVAQILATRLKMFQGEWFLNLLDGLPLFQKILGSSGSPRSLQVVINLIAARILGTPFVIGVSNFNASFQNRQFVYTASVSTQFGTITIGNSPGNSANLEN